MSLKANTPVVSAGASTRVLNACQTCIFSTAISFQNEMPREPPEASTTSGYTACDAYSLPRADGKSTFLRSSDVRRAADSNRSGWLATRPFRKRCPVPTGSTLQTPCLRKHNVIQVRLKTMCGVVAKSLFSFANFPPLKPVQFRRQLDNFRRTISNRLWRNFHGH